MGIKIHNVFHVSCINKVIGKKISVSWMMKENVFSFQKKSREQGREGYYAEQSKNIWYNGRICLVRRPLGKMNFFCRIQNCHLLRTINIGWGGFSCPHSNRSTS